MRASYISALLAGSILLTSDLQAAIHGLINTGKDANGALLASGSEQPGWSILSVTPLNPLPGGGLTPSTAPYKTFVVDAYVGYWSQPTPNDASKWISYSTPLWLGGATARQFTYGLSFDAAAGDSFRVRVSSDQNAEVYVNSISPENRLVKWGDLDPGNFVPFQSFSPWLTASGLRDGQNTLFCVVGEISQNYLNPSGLRVEFSAVPEPSLAALLASGLLILLARRNKVAL